jgi:hypothetical protein
MNRNNMEMNIKQKGTLELTTAAVGLNVIMLLE